MNLFASTCVSYCVHGPIRTLDPCCIQCNLPLDCCVVSAVLAKNKHATDQGTLVRIYREERELILREHRQIEDAIKIEVQRALSCTHAYPLEVRDGENQRGIPSRAVRVAGGGLRQIGADRS